MCVPPSDFHDHSRHENDVRGGYASEKSTLHCLPANGMPSWGLLLWLLGFKGAVQLQIAMEIAPFACRVFVAIYIQ